MKELINATVKSKTGNEVPKSYIKLEPFITVEDGVDADSAEYPVEEVRPARGLEDDAKKGKIPLLFRSKFMQCPHCKKLYPVGGGRRTCDNRDCSYYTSNDKFYRFKAGELKGNAEGAKPYVITFDFINNKCDVTMP